MCACELRRTPSRRSSQNLPFTSFGGYLRRCHRPVPTKAVKMAPDASETILTPRPTRLRYHRNITVSGNKRRVFRQRKRNRAMPHREAYGSRVCTLLQGQTAERVTCRGVKRVDGTADGGKVP